jgi:hypothetical protein
MDDHIPTHADIMAELRAIREAFPGGDTEGHRRAHETMIELLEERRKLRIAVQEKTISGLIWAGIVAILTSIYHQYFTK